LSIVSKSGMFQHVKNRSLTPEYEKHTKNHGRFEHITAIRNVIHLIKMSGNSIHLNFMPVCHPLLYALNVSSVTQCVVRYPSVSSITLWLQCVFNLNFMEITHSKHLNEDSFSKLNA